MNVAKLPVEVAGLMERYRLPAIVTTFGLCIILYWIGAFKFTPLESQQIMVYIAHSPFMSWLYDLFAPLTTSRIIGVTEMLAATGLLLGFVKPYAGLLGSLLCVGIFFMTSTFMLTTPHMVAFADGMWHTSPMGSFVLKDVTLLGGSLYLAVHYGRLHTGREAR